MTGAARIGWRVSSVFAVLFSATYVKLLLLPPHDFEPVMFGLTIVYWLAVGWILLCLLASREEKR